MTVATQPLHAAFANALAEGASPPADIQYMPPGCRHGIRASRGGKPVEVDVSVDASTAAAGGGVKIAKNGRFEKHLVIS